MNINEKLQLVESEIDRSIQKIKPRRDGDRAKAFGLKIASVFLAGIITVLLGLSNVGLYDIWLKNIALILGVLITVFNAYDAFFDHRSLWIGQTITLSRLRALKLDLAFYKAGAEPNELDIETVTNFKNRYNHIQEEAKKEWLRLRVDDETQVAEIRIDENLTHS